MFIANVQAAVANSITLRYTCSVVGLAPDRCHFAIPQLS